MRDYVFIPLVIFLTGAALWHPWMGVLAWTWVSMMNPHALTWSSGGMPVAAMIGGATLVGAVFTRERKSFSVTPESAVLMLFMVWVTATFPLYFSPEGSYDVWSKAMKIDLMILVTLALLHTRRQIELFVWVIVLSLGFYGVKGGIFTIATGGGHRVWGPGGFIGENNALALALIMVIPLMRFLQLQAKQVWLRHAWTATMLLTAAAALGTQSRGALLALGAMGIYLWFKSPHKLVFGIGMSLAAVALLAIMSDKWEARMGTIANYEEDASARGRLNAWAMAWNVAKDRVAGGGFEMWTPQAFAIYAPDPTDPHAAHSIYFQVLGEHGFIGLFLFLLMWWLVWRSAGWLIREGGRAQETQWCRHLGAMCQVSLIAYAAGGAFLSLAYYDLPYNILAIVVLTKRWMKEQKVAVQRGPAQVPGTRPQHVNSLARLR